MTEYIILYNDHLSDRISFGFFREKFINCTDEGTAIQYTFYYSPSHRLSVPQSKKWHNFIDGRAPLLTGGEADFGNRAHIDKFLLWIRKVVRYHGFIGKENTSPITNRMLSYPKQMHNVLFFVLQLLLVL